MTHADFALAEQTANRLALAASQPRSRPASHEVELSIHHDLAAVEPVWRSLQQQGICTVFQTFEWLSAWQRNIGRLSHVTPCVVVGRDANGAPLFVMPLAVQSHGFARELTWLGSDLCDYNAPLMAAGRPEAFQPAKFIPVWQRILAELQANPQTAHDLVRLEKMPPTIGGQPNPMLALSTALNPSGSYATPLTANWDEFYAAKRSSSTRRRDRSKRKHLGEFGEVKFVTAVNHGAALDTLAVLVEQKTATFSRHGIRNLFARPGYLDFYRDIAGDAKTDSFVHISRLEVGEQVAATNLGLVFGGRYYHVLASYTDNELSRRGPGAAHLNDLLRYAIERGLTTFDFTIGDERYKRDWCDGVQSLYDHVTVTSWRGALVAGPAILLNRIKRTIKQTPALWAIVVKLRAMAALLRGWGKAGTAARPDGESDAA